MSDKFMRVTVGQCVNNVRRMLSHLESGYIDAELITGFILKLDRSGLRVKWDEPVSEDDSREIEKLARRRGGGEPIAYIIQSKSFWRDDFFVKKTLIPRPDSESVIELTLDLFRDKNTRFYFADLGIGSGCLAVSLLREYRSARAVGVDIDNAAVISSRLNCDRCGVSNRIVLLRQSWGKRIPSRERARLIICNPPYIKTRDCVDLEVRYHEPVKALVGGMSGLEKFTEVMRLANIIMRNDGIIIFEMGWGQSRDLFLIARKYGFREIADRKDLGGIKRAVAFKRMRKL